MAEMSKGQPDPRPGARPMAPEPFGREAADFLGLDQAFGDAGASGAPAGPWDVSEGDELEDQAYATEEEAAWDAEEGSFADPSADPYGEPEEGELESLAGFVDPEAMGTLEDHGDPEDPEDPDFDFEESEVASWLMELEGDPLEGLGHEDFADLEAAEPHLAGPFQAPQAAPSRSPILLAALVMISVGAGVGLSKVLTRFGQEGPPTELIALGPRTPPERAPSPSASRPAPPLDAGQLRTPPSVALAEPRPLEPTPEVAPAAVEPEPAPRGFEPEAVALLEPAPGGTEAPSAPPQPTPRLDPALFTPAPRVLDPAGPSPAAPAGPSAPVARLLPELDPEPLAPLRGPVREASADDLASLWAGTTIPLEAIEGEEHLATPFVGRVRVVARNGEIYEGRLHGLGNGRIWLESGQSKMALMGWQISRIEHVLGGENTPTLGHAGSEDLSGLPSVRVRTAGGVFYGKLVSQEGDRTTLITAEGARVRLDGGIVEPAGRSRTRVVEVVAEAAKSEG